MMPSNTQARSPWLGALQTRWGKLAPRERALLGMAALLVGATLLWQLLLAPALQTLRSADAQRKSLDAQLQHMRTMQSQAKALQQQAPLSYADALRALQQATKQTLGATAQVTVVAERANISLQASSADALAQWLAQARLNARSAPLEARLTQTIAPTGVTWTGTVVMSLPQRQ